MVNGTTILIFQCASNKLVIRHITNFTMKIRGGPTNLGTFDKLPRDHFLRMIKKINETNNH